MCKKADKGKDKGKGKGNDKTKNGSKKQDVESKSDDEVERSLENANATVPGVEAEIVVPKASRKGRVVSRGVGEQIKEGTDGVVEMRRNPRRAAKPPSKYNDFLDPESL